MPSISTQTTTFLPAVVPVLQRRSLTKRFLTSMMRKHGKDVKQNNTNRAKFQRDVTANKKALTKILKDMTLTIRNNMSEAAKKAKDAKKALKEADKVLKDAKKDADKADKEQAKKATKKAQEQRKFDAAVNKFSAELKQSAKMEEKSDLKEQKLFEAAAKIFAADQNKMDHLSERALRNQATAEFISNNTNDAVFIPFLGWVSAK